MIGGGVKRLLNGYCQYRYKMKLSVIIPLYNVAGYIRDCLNSICQCGLSQADFEIVIVDDGSTDGSADIAESFLIEHQSDLSPYHWRIIHQVNGGASAARNTGLRASSGQYVWWVDGDDLIEHNSVADLLSILDKNGLDVLCFGLKLLYENGSTELYRIFSQSDGEVLKGDTFIYKVGMTPSIWLAIYRREYLFEKQLWMKEGIVHEDQEFPPRAYFLANRIMYIPRNIYYYRQREGSIMKSEKHRAKKAKDLLVVCDSLYEFTQRYVKKDSEAYKVFNNKIAFAFGQSLRNYMIGDFPIEIYKTKPYYPLKLNSYMSFRDQIKYSLANCSLSVYLYMHNTISK